MSSALPKKRPRQKSRQQKAEDLRNRIWPDSEERIWTSKENNGYVPLSRLLPLIATLLDELAKPGDPTRVYYDLWFRCHDDGYVPVDDVERFAFSAGYRGTRAVRTWRERMLKLQELGFIDCKGIGTNDFKHVLLINPLLAVAQLRQQFPKRVPEDWWISFVERAGDIGAILPRLPSKKLKTTPK